MALEPEFWRELDALCEANAVTLPALIVRLDAERGIRSLASACRLAALAFVKQSGRSA